MHLLAKIAFLSLCVLLSAAAKTNQNMTIGVASPFAPKAPGDFDPAAIEYSFHFNVLKNLLSTLVEDQRDDGMITPGLASSIQWRGNQLYLPIRPDAVTVSGKKVTASDAAFSLKRLLVLKKNTHGQLGALLCPDAPMKTVEDICSGINVEGNTLILTPSHGKAFLLQMLTAADFGIVTRSSVDPRTLTIVSHKETSGPYYMDSIEPDGSFVLKANPRHWLYKADIPRTATFIRRKTKPNDIPAPFRQFEDGSVDFILNSSLMDKSAFTDFADKHPEAKLSVAGSTSRTLLIFTQRGMKELTAEQRLSIGKSIREAYLKQIASPHHHRIPAQEWFFEQGDAPLSSDQTAKLASDYSATVAAKDGHGLKLSGWNLSEINKALAGVLPGLSIVGDLGEYQERLQKDPLHIQNDDPHMYITNTDGMWVEDITFLSYALSNFYFDIDPKEGAKFFASYLDNPEKSKRLSLLRDLEYKTLLSGKVVPLLAQSTFSLVRDGWEKDPRSIFQSGYLWELHLKH